MTLQELLTQLAPAAVLAVPLTARAIPAAIDRWSKAKVAAADAQKTAADAKKTEADAALKKAEAERIEAETTSTAMADFRARLDDCEKRHDEQGEQIQALQRQGALDAELLLKFSEKIENDAAVIRGLRQEVDELRNIVKTGG